MIWIIKIHAERIPAMCTAIVRGRYIRLDRAARLVIQHEYADRPLAPDDIIRLRDYIVSVNGMESVMTARAKREILDIILQYVVPVIGGYNG